MDNQQPSTTTPPQLVPIQPIPAATEPLPQVVAKKAPKEMKKILIIVAVIAILLLVLMIGINILSRMRSNNIVVAPSPTPEVTAPPVTPPPTRYATDSAVLEIEKNINGLDTELSQVDIDEVNLKPRSMQWEVKFD